MAKKKDKKGLKMVSSRKIDQFFRAPLPPRQTTTTTTTTTASSSKPPPATSTTTSSATASTSKTSRTGSVSNTPSTSRLPNAAGSASSTKPGQDSQLPSGAKSGLSLAKPTQDPSQADRSIFVPPNLLAARFAAKAAAAAAAKNGNGKKANAEPSGHTGHGTAKPSHPDSELAASHPTTIPSTFPTQSGTKPLSDITPALSASNSPFTSPDRSQIKGKGKKPIPLRISPASGSKTGLKLGLPPKPFRGRTLSSLTNPLAAAAAKIQAPPHAPVLEAQWLADSVAMDIDHASTVEDEEKDVVWSVSNNFLGQSSSRSPEFNRPPTPAADDPVVAAANEIMQSPLVASWVAQQPTPSSASRAARSNSPTPASGPRASPVTSSSSSSSRAIRLGTSSLRTRKAAVKSRAAMVAAAAAAVQRSSSSAALSGAASAISPASSSSTPGAQSSSATANDVSDTADGNLDKSQPRSATKSARSGPMTDLSPRSSKRHKPGSASSASSPANHLPPSSSSSTTHAPTPANQPLAAAIAAAAPPPLARSPSASSAPSAAAAAAAAAAVPTTKSSPKAAPAPPTKVAHDSLVHNLFDGLDMSQFDEEPKSFSAVPPSATKPQPKPLVGAGPSTPKPFKSGNVPLPRPKTSPIKAGTRYHAAKRSMKPVRLMVIEVRPLNRDIWINALDEEQESQIIVILKDSWADSTNTPVAHGDWIHVLGQPKVSAQGHRTYYIDGDQSWLIVHPDIMAGPSRIPEAVTCQRKAVLSTKGAGAGGKSVPAFYGDMLHSIFQWALRHNIWTTEALQKQIVAELSLRLDIAYGLGLTDSAVHEKLATYLESMQLWAANYLNTPVPAPVTTAPARSASTTAPRDRVRVSRVLDIEENVWSPTFGLRGKVDVSVEMEIAPADGSPQFFAPAAPLEIKSGSGGISFMEHSAQAMLYQLMIGDRYSIADPGRPLVYYMTTKEMVMPDPRRDFKVSLIQTRNQIAAYVASPKQELPPMKQNEYTCKHCFLKEACMMHHKALESGNAVSAGVGPLWNGVVGHVPASALAYYAHWFEMIALESSDYANIQHEIWTLSAKEREAVGRCMADMVIVNQTKTESSTIYTFHRRAAVAANTLLAGKGKAPDDKPAAGARSLLELSFSVGDRVVLSALPDDLASGVGFIVNLSATAVDIQVAGALRGPPTKDEYADPKASVRFQSLSDMEDGSSNSSSRVHASHYVWRLDKDEYASSFSTLKTNLIRLASTNGVKESRLRALIIDTVPPRFSNKLFAPEDVIQNAIDSCRLNSDQVKAVRKVLGAEDYALILGMPGTGKTTTIAALIKIISDSGGRVFLTAYGNQAVDNVLEKLIKLDVPFWRVGDPRKVTPAVRSRVLNGDKSLTTIAELEAALNGPSTSDGRPVNVIASTALRATSSPIFSQLEFDFTILDEASQITEPTCLGPVFLSKRFVLVGDHYQLGPIVRNPRAAEMGMSESLFRRLSERQPKSVATLSMQYRMAAPIMQLANSLVYGHRLSAGSEAVANQRLQLPGGEACLGEPRPGHRDWIRQTLGPGSPSVVWLNTDEVPGREDFDQATMSAVNSIEAMLVGTMVGALARCGVPMADVGIITPLRSQMKMLNVVLDAAKESGGIGSPESSSQLEISTIDRYQGRDKEVILVSLVRSNTRGASGTLLSDWRRLNVAMTRAKKKIVFVGSLRTMHCSSSIFMQDLVRSVANNDQIISLAPNAHQAYEGTALLQATWDQVVGRREAAVASASSAATPGRPTSLLSPVRGGSQRASQQRHSQLSATRSSPHPLAAAFASSPTLSGPQPANEAASGTSSKSGPASGSGSGSVHGSVNDGDGRATPLHTFLSGQALSRSTPSVLSPLRGITSPPASLLDATRSLNPEQVDPAVVAAAAAMDDPPPGHSLGDEDPPLPEPL